MKKSIASLENVKTFVDSTYNGFGSFINIELKDKPYGPYNRDLGYCFKFSHINPNNPLDRSSIYKIVYSTVGSSETDFRVLMHEYGHIYFGHLDGIHEELDVQICNLLRDYRGEIVERLNKECGIDFGEELVEQIIDDPRINHSLHNIAMDMEINSKILSKEDIEEMEADVVVALTREHTKALDKILQDGNLDEEKKKACEEEKDRILKETEFKLILPCRYYTAPNVPFADELTYPEYLLKIVNHLDQFVKHLASIKLGKGQGGDTSGITSDDINEALGGNNSMQGLNDLLNEVGLGGTNPDGDQTEVESPYGGQREDNTKDHGTDSREEADQKRELGEIRSKGGAGCGDDSGSKITRKVKENTDPLELGIEEVITNFKHKVVKFKDRKDVMYTYNRGINRSVFTPVVKRKLVVDSQPTIVFLIDISGSMDTDLVDRVLTTISTKVKKINRGLRYNIISWNTGLGEHIKDIDPCKPVPRISVSGSTRMARGIKYFKDHYEKDAVLIIISDFEDYLEEWHEVEKNMPGFSMYGFNYGRNYKQEFKYLKVRNCRSNGKSYY